MADCTSQTLAGLVQDCEGSKGGIVTVYARTWADNIYTVTSGEVSAVAGTATDWKVYHFRKNSSSMTSTLNVDPANGVNYVSTDVNLVFARMETTKRIEMAAMALADMAMVVRDSNGKLYALGKEEPVTATEGSGETGVNRTDGNKYSITLQDNQSSFPMILDATAASTFLALFN